MNTIIHKIKEYMPNENITFRRHEITDNVEVVFRQSVITILDTNTWDEIKRHIDAKLNMNKDIDCSICCEDMKNKRVSCPKCANYWCIKCYINIYKINKGLIKCPYCRFEYGEEQCDDLLELGVREIIKKSGI